MSEKLSKNVLNYDLNYFVQVKNSKFNLVITFKMQMHSINSWLKFEI